MATRSLWLDLSPRLVGGVILAILVARLAFAAAIPLTEDEAYYRLWSMRLQMGYFDHPPMIAWWIAGGRMLVGDNALGVRLLPVVAAAASAFLLIDTMRGLGCDRPVALRAGLWINATLLIGIGGFLAVPDAPAAFFWIVTLWALSRAVAPDRLPTAVAWWALAGAAGGAAVLSKYSALFLAAGILIWLGARRENRRHLTSAGPWIAAGMALIVMAPHILWNARHDWVSAAKQFGRVQAEQFRPEFLAEFVLGQALLLNPIIAVLAVLAVSRWRRDRLDAAMSFLRLTSLPFLAYLLIHSLHDRVQAHWPAPVYPALVGLAAIAARAVPGIGSVPQWRRAVPILGIGLSMIVLIAATTPVFDRALGAAVSPLRGWSTFASTLQSQADDDTKRDRSIGWIGTASYGLAAQLKASPH